MDLGKCMLSQQVGIPRIKPLRFLEVSLASVPFAASARYIGKKLRDSATVWKEGPRLLQVTFGCVVLFETGIVIVCFCHHSFAEFRLKSQCRVGRFESFLAQLVGWLQKSGDIAAGIDTG